MNAWRTLFLTGAVLAGTAIAQNPEDTRPATVTGAGSELAASEVSVPAAPSSAIADDLYYAPIRSGADDNGFRYGTWASGARYKISFHDGAVFYPVVGARYPHNLPVGWTTTSVTVGPVELMVADEVARHAATDWRYEYRYGAFTESYDVLNTGVEQTFTIQRRPAARGDLVISGRLATELQAAPRGFAHGPLVFHHADGTDLVRYGEAFAIDAAGDRRPVQTAFDGAQISLRLDAAWLDQAAFPIVVDPLIGNVLVSFDSSNRQASRPDVGRDDIANDLMTVYGRLNSSGDYDAYARITDDDFSNTQLVWTDITASWSTRNCDVAFVGGAARWIIALQRDFPSPTGSWIRYHVHDSGDLTLSTAWNALAGSNGNSLTFPEVGGTYAYSSGNNALVVYQSDTGLANTGTSEVFAHLVDVQAMTVGPAINLETGATFDRETPSVNPESNGGTSSWICCWSQLDRSISGDDWDLIIRRIDSTGASGGRSFLGDSGAAAHAYQPKVAGRGGRYMASYGEDTNVTGNEPNGWAPRIRVQRFDWSESATSPVKQDYRLVRSSTTTEFWNGAIAYDSNTTSHWAFVYHSDNWNVYAARAGYDGGVCEAVTVYDTTDLAFSPSITFNDDLNEFPIVFTATEGGAQPQPVYGNILTYPTFTNPTSYGTNCGPAILSSNANAHSTKPHSGQQFFRILVSGAPNNTTGALNVGMASAAIPIPFLPGCFINTGSIVVSLPANASGSTVTVPAPIPGGVAGDLYFQYVYVDRGSPNPIPVSTSNGLLVRIR